MSAEDQVVASQANAEPQKKTFDAKAFKAQLDSAVENRKTFLSTWRESVNYRVQKPFGPATDTTTQDQIAVPEDWARTKQKTAQLSFHLPKIIARALAPEFVETAPKVQAYVNWVARHEVNGPYVIDEVLSDVINASGLMVSVVGVDRRYEETEVDKVFPPIETVDPVTQLPVALPNPLNGTEKEKVRRLVHQSYYWKRISAAAFLWPSEFTESNFDEAPWLGYESWIHLEEAKKIYEKLPKDFKATTSKPALLSADLVSGEVKKGNSNYVKVTTAWYKASLFDPTVVHPKQINEIVFVEGFDEPVVHEPSSWQKFVEESVTPEGETIPSRYLGICKFPIRAGTLVYVSDLPVPPSDSEAARPQVREMIKSRGQMLRQRDAAIPIRWFDTNRLDETIADRLRNGEWQDMIPTNGPGDRVIGEVARANYPRESLGVYQVIGADLDRSWSLSNNQLATPNSGERSATEVREVSSASQVRLDYEKERVNRYVVEAMEVLFSLMQLTLNKTQYAMVVGGDGKEELVKFDQAALAGDYAFEFVPDSSDRIDAVTKQLNIVKVYNLLANSDTINKAYLEEEILIAHGLDPAKAKAQPKEPPPPPLNVSFRFSGEDLLNPMAVATMKKAGYQLTPEDIKEAAQMIQDSIRQMNEAKQRVFGEPTPGMEATPPSPLTDGSQPPQGDQPVEPPETVEPILKRANDGSRLM